MLLKLESKQYWGLRQSYLEWRFEFAMPAQSRAKARRAACELSTRLNRFCCNRAPLVPEIRHDKSRVGPWQSMCGAGLTVAR